MLTRRTLFALVALVVCTLILAAQSRLGPRPAPPRGLGFTIDVRAPDYFTEGSALPLVGHFKNQGKLNAELLLKDHDDYHGTLPYPVGLMAKVVDETGAVVTRNDVSRDDWWSSYYVWSQLCVASAASGECLMPGDVITLRPGEEVVRIIPLARVLAGNRARPNGLRAGKYVVQLKLVAGDQVSLFSNELTVEVKPKGE